MVNSCIKTSFDCTNAGFSCIIWLLTEKTVDMRIL